MFILGLIDVYGSTDVTGFVDAYDKIAVGQGPLCPWLFNDQLTVIDPLSTIISQQESFLLVMILAIYARLPM